MAIVSPLDKYKLVFLGDESVGKSNIITAYMYRRFDTAYNPTIGIDFLSKTMYVDDDKALRFQLWDTAGQMRFRSLIPSYIRDSSVALIVYDVTNRQSFLNIAKWIEEVRKERSNDAIIVLVGNKTDLVDKRQVAVEEGDVKAREFGLNFIETSAKEGFNIKRLFRYIARGLLESHSSTEQEDEVDVNLKSSDNMPSTSVVTSSQSAQGSVDNKNITDLDNVSSAAEVQHSKNNLSHVSHSYTSNTQELKVGDSAEDNTKTNDNNSLTLSNNENIMKDNMDNRPSSMLEELLKRMDEMQEGNKRLEEKINEVKGCCQSLKVYDQRCDDMLKRMEDILKRMEETQKGKKRVDENIHEVEGRSLYDQRFENMLKRMEEMQEGNRRMDERIKEVEGLVERGKLDDIKRREDTSKKLAEMADNMFRRLEKLESHNYIESSEPLKIIQQKKGEDGDEDVVFV